MSWLDNKILIIIYLDKYNYNLCPDPTTTFELITLSKNLPQKTATSSAPLQHQYEVTENNNITLKEYQTIPPALQLQNLDIRKLYSIIMNNPLQSNQLFTNHPIISSMDTTRSTNVEFDQSSVPMQTNLHTSLHVGFPATASQTPYAITQQIPTDLHVGHSTPAGSPLSGTEFYELLNNISYKLPEQHILGIICKIYREYISGSI